MAKHRCEPSEAGTFFYDACKCGAFRQRNTLHPMTWIKRKVTKPWSEVLNFMPKGEVS